jgi:hypothetical protein
MRGLIMPERERSGRPELPSAELLKRTGHQVITEVFIYIEFIADMAVRFAIHSGSTWTTSVEKHVLFRQGLSHRKSGCLVITSSNIAYFPVGQIWAKIALGLFSPTIIWPQYEDSYGSSSPLVG